MTLLCSYLSKHLPHVANDFLRRDLVLFIAQLFVEFIVVFLFHPGLTYVYIFDSYFVFSSCQLFVI